MDKLIYPVLGTAVLMGLVGCVKPRPVTESAATEESQVSAGVIPPEQAVENTAADESLSQQSSAQPADTSTADAGAGTEASGETESQPTAAQPSPVPLEKKDCGQLETQQAMNQCAADNHKIADDELNKVYQEVLQGLDERAKKQLVDAEKQWITFRDAQCDFESDHFEGGSLAPLMKSSCLESITDNRTAELKNGVSPSLSFAAADAQLNQLYQAVQSYAPEDRKKALTDVQFNWLDYRDAHCEYEANLASGINIETCLAAITELRVWELQDLRNRGIL